MRESGKSDIKANLPSEIPIQEVLPLHTAINIAQEMTGPPREGNYTTSHCISSSERKSDAHFRLSQGVKTI